MVSSPRHRLINRKFVSLLAILGLGAYEIYSVDDHREKIFELVRIFRAVFTGFAIFVIYRYLFRSNYDNQEEFQRHLKKTHEICANLFLNMCLKNKGLYIKMGQTVSSLNHIIPSEWIEILAVLRDKTLHQDFKFVERIIKEDLGDSIENLFRAFETVPLASASIAQVHRAITKDGDDVAVKIQFFYLKNQYPIDIKAIRFFCSFLEYFAPQFKLGWVFKLVEEKLKLELDFELERQNSQRCKDMLSDLPYAYVPSVFSDLSGQRIITMEFIDGFTINDRQSIESNFKNPGQIMENLVKIFSYQIFRHGFVHADPHASNVLIRKNEKTQQPQIVLLDHGLYENLDEETRLKLAKFWIAGTTSDIEQLKITANELNVEDYTCLWEIFFQRPYLLNATGQIRLMAKLTPEDRKELIKRAGAERIEQISNVLEKLPPQLILVLRNLNMVRSLTQMHNDPFDRYYVIAKIAYKECNKNIFKRSLTSYCTYYFKDAIFYLKYMISKFRYKLIEIYFIVEMALNGIKLPFKAKYVENI